MAKFKTIEVTDETRVAIHLDSVSEVSQLDNVIKVFYKQSSVDTTTMTFLNRWDADEAYESLLKALNGQR